MSRSHISIMVDVSENSRAAHFLAASAFDHQAGSRASSHRPTLLLAIARYPPATRFRTW